MKISFVNPGPILELPSKEKAMVGATPPLGIIYIAAVLKNAGVDVSILDESGQGFSLKNILDWVKREDPDVLGFSTLNISGRRAALIAEKVKLENPTILIVFGNHYATFNAVRVLRKYPCVDVIVRGEGEYTMLELAKCIEKKEDYSKVLGITFKKGAKTITTPERPLIQKLDALPFPERELLNTEYHSVTAGINVAPKKFTSFLSSRGCVFKCRFCSCQKIAKGLWRPRSVNNIMEELHYLASEGYEQILFVDDCFTINSKRIKTLCQRMRKERVDLEWIAEGRVDSGSYDMFRDMALSGCKMIYFGVESANQNILNYYNKRTTPFQAETAIKKARRAGIDIIMASFIVGAPGETRKEILNTLNFPRKLKVDVPQFNILEALPGTDIWDELKMSSILNEEKYWETGVFASKVCPDAVPYDEIVRMISEAYRRFLIHPEYMLKLLQRTITSSYRLNLLMNNISRFPMIIADISSRIYYQHKHLLVGG